MLASNGVVTPKRRPLSSSSETRGRSNDGPASGHPMQALVAEPSNIEDLGVHDSIVIDLIYRMLFNERDVSVTRCATVLCLPTGMVDRELAKLKTENKVEISKAGGLGSISYTYRLTEAGTERARQALERSLYVGPVPVDIADYNKAVEIQADNAGQVSPELVQKALSHLVLPENFHRRIGPAVNAGTSLFLYGPPGNGKTTIAEACAELLAGTAPIFMPYALHISGQIVQLFDSLKHIEVVPDNDFLQHFKKWDQRWAVIKRPSVMVGGELDMNALELRFEPVGRFYEAPLQMKANCGMFLIDDFGRQQITPEQLLNRWIVPLETRIDMLTLQSGQTIQFPFKQLIVFSTNLDPADLADDAFLRRIQIKVEVGPPDEKLFYELFRIMCGQLNVPFDKEGFVYLLTEWFRGKNRAMQATHPRDLLKTIISICDYLGEAPNMKPPLLQEACESYFVDMERERAWTMGMK